MKCFSKYILATLTLCLLVSIPQNSYAQNSQLCVTKADSVITKRKCGKLTTYKPGCGSCGQSMAGDWTYTPIDNTNSPGTQRSITFTQSGGIFEGSNAYHTIVGKVEGRWVRLTQTVSGEEGMGWVRLAEGSLFVTDGGFTLGTLAVVGDTFGSGGALILRKAP